MLLIAVYSPFRLLLRKSDCRLVWIDFSTALWTSYLSPRWRALPRLDLSVFFAVLFLERSTGGRGLIIEFPSWRSSRASASRTLMPWTSQAARYIQWPRHNPKHPPTTAAPLPPVATSHTSSILLQRLTVPNSATPVMPI